MKLSRSVVATLIQLSLALFLLFHNANAATAQKSADASSLNTLIEQAQKDGMTVVIMGPDQASNPTEETAASKSMTDNGLHLRREVRRLLTHSADIPDRLSAAFEIASPDGTWWCAA